MYIATSLAQHIIPHHVVVIYMNNKIELRIVFDTSVHRLFDMSLDGIISTGQNYSKIHVNGRYKHNMMCHQTNILPTDRQYQDIL